MTQRYLHDIPKQKVHNNVKLDLWGRGFTVKKYLSLNRVVGYLSWSIVMQSAINFISSGASSKSLRKFSTGNSIDCLYMR